MSELTKRQVDMLRHACSDNDGTRNQWVDTPGNAEAEALVEGGWFVRGRLFCEMQGYYVSPAGLALVERAVAAERKRKGLRLFRVFFDYRGERDTEGEEVLAQSHGAAKYLRARDLSEPLCDHSIFDLMRSMRVRLAR